MNLIYSVSHKRYAVFLFIVTKLKKQNFKCYVFCGFVVVYIEGLIYKKSN